MIDMGLIAVPLSVHLGKKLIDRLWPDARNGNGVMVSSEAGSLVAASQPNVYAPSLVPDDVDQPVPWPPPTTQRISISTLVSDSLPRQFIANSVNLTLVVDEMSGGTAIFESDLNAPTIVDLPPSTYSFYSFLVDARTPQIDSAPLYGLGLPLHGDVAGAQYLQFEHPGQIFDLMVDAPCEIWIDGPDTLQLLMVNTADFSDLPHVFGDLMLGQDGWMTGTWWIEDAVGDAGQSRSSLELVHEGNALHGTATTLFTANGQEWAAQQLVSGNVKPNGAMSLSAYQVRLLRAPDGSHYNPDGWFGQVRDRDTVVGESVDAAGMRGSFVMRRQAVA